jgi:hypothetical protein
MEREAVLDRYFTEINVEKFQKNKLVGTRFLAY